MTPTRRWFDRKFELGLGPEGAPELFARLKSTPRRLAETVRDLSPDILTRRRDGKWSIQENAGHLWDLEALWDERLNDYESGANALHAADLENRKTHEANHHARSIEKILAKFASARNAIMDRLERTTPAELSRTSLHPRLRQPMSVVDLCYFVAEHDDHHLQTIEELRGAFTND